MAIRLEDLERIVREMLAILETNDSFSDCLVDDDTLRARWYEAFRTCRSIDDEISLPRERKGLGG